MQWVEGLLWLNGPAPHSPANRLLTVGFIPVALLAQAWGPLLGSACEVPVRRRRLPFFLLLALGLAIVVISRVVYHPPETQVTPQGHLNWWSLRNPPVFPAWAYSLWAVVIGAPFLLWWRPLWQALLIVSWGWVWAVVGFWLTDSAASYWCFHVSFYAAFVLIYAWMTPDPPARGDEPTVTDQPSPIGSGSH